MTYGDCLEIVADWAAILTAVVAVGAYGVYRWERRAKRRRLEDYLRAEKDRGGDKGQRTLVHLVARVGMSESDIMDSAFRSKKIERKLDTENGKAIGIFLEYKP